MLILVLLHLRLMKKIPLYVKKCIGHGFRLLTYRRAKCPRPYLVEIEKRYSGYYFSTSQTKRKRGDLGVH